MNFLSHLFANKRNLLWLKSEWYNKASAAVVGSSLTIGSC